MRELEKIKKERAAQREEEVGRGLSAAEDGANEQNRSEPARRRSRSNARKTSH